ncbi:hypothetical protein KQI84_07735 [bacterium]|nr:hypothetical protein [bacterium]
MNRVATISRSSLSRRVAAFMALFVGVAGLCFAQGGGTATRDLPAEMVALTPYDVTISVVPTDPPSSPVAMAVEEDLPTGWSASAPTSGGLITATDIRWGLFEGEDIHPVTFQYTVTPSLDHLGSVAISGRASFDGVGITIGGDTSVTVTVPDSLLQTTVDVYPTDGSADVAWTEAPYPNLERYDVRRDGVVIGTLLPTAPDLLWTDNSYSAADGATYTVQAIGPSDSILFERHTQVLALHPFVGQSVDSIVRGTFQSVDYGALSGSNSETNVAFDMRLANPSPTTTDPAMIPNAVLPANGSTSATTVLAIDRAGFTDRDIAFIVEQLLPQEYAEVFFHETKTVSQISGGQEIELFADPMVRGVPVDVSVRITNPGPLDRQVITQRDSGHSDVIVGLYDTLGNLLTESYLDQSAPTGGAQFGANKSFATIAPGESFLTEPISVLVPLDAPDEVLLLATVPTFYYDIDSATEQTVPGTEAALGATITSPPYLANVAAEFEYYASGSEVRIFGNAYDPVSLNPEPGVNVKIGINVKGFDRFEYAKTDVYGNFIYTFRPFTTEAGNYTIWGVHPDVEDRPAQDTFIISGLRFQPPDLTVTMPRNSTFPFNVSLKNLGEDLQTLTSVEFLPAGQSADLTATVNSYPATIGAGRTSNISVTIDATTNSPTNTQLILLAQGNHGSQAELTLDVETYVGGPVLSADPSYIETGAIVDEVTVATTEISNVGTEPLLNARVTPPTRSWIDLSIDPVLGDIAAGASREIPMTLLPDSSVTPGIYSETVRIESDNLAPFDVYMSIRVIGTDSGDLLVRCGTLLATEEPIEGLEVLIQEANPAGPTPLRLSGVTDADGLLFFEGLPPGDFDYTIGGSGYQVEIGTVTIKTGELTELHLLMRKDFVTVGFTVTPITIEDRYEIVIDATFETDVLAPVMVLDPPHLELMPVAGTSMHNNLIIANKGLIAMRDAQFPVIETSDFRVEPLVTELGDIPARDAIQVPFRIVTPYPEEAPTRRTALADMMDKGHRGTIGDLFQIVCDIFEKCDFDPEIPITAGADLCGGTATVYGSVKLSVLCKIIPKIPTSLGDLASLLLPDHPALTCAKESLQGGGVPGSGCLCELAGAITGDSGVTPCCKALTGLGLKDMYDCMCKYTKCDCPTGAGGGRVWAQGGGGGGGGGGTVNDPCD